LNEAEAFLVVVELHGARIHRGILSLILSALDPKARIGDSGLTSRYLEGLSVRLAFSEGETA
jgi:hypothetical protein